MFTSYAQNFEDVMLARCFRGDTGFYVDVGAHDPDIDSVTRAFYERGWHGLNVEPLPGPAARLRVRRPRDITVEAACGAGVGPVTLYSIDGEGGVSTTDAGLAAEHAANGYGGQPITVDQVPLSVLLERYAPGPVFEFLKVDVEGAEAAVLQSAGLDRFRPQVIVVETRLPVRFEMVDRVDEVPDRYAEIGDLLAPFRYRQVWRDGTNTFYVADEASALARHFERPPGVFDRFLHAATLRVAEARIAQLEAELARLKR